MYDLPLASSSSNKKNPQSLNFVSFLRVPTSLILNVLKSSSQKLYHSAY